MATTPTTDVVVVGGGVIGLAVAWEAAVAGMTVTVVDPEPGRGASWAAAGMLAPAGEAQFGEEDLTALNVVASRSWPGFARRLEAASGLAVGYVADGAMLVAVDASDRLACDDVLGFQQSLGLDARRLSARECRSLEPMLSPAVSGGVELADDHQVDNRLVIAALIAAGRAAGVTFVDDEVAGVEIGAGRVVGVRLRGGDDLPGHAVVVAAGCRSGQLDGLPGSVLPPVRPVKGLTLRLGRVEGVPALRRSVRGLVHGRRCYLVPRADGSVVVGATVEEKGFDLTVQVGAVGDLLEDARRLVPSLEEYTLDDVTTGLRPGSPDNAPMVGTTGIGGLVVATGHYRNGILLAPLTAQEVVRLLGAETETAGSGADGPFGPFGPGRFAGGPTGGSNKAGADATRRVRDISGIPG
jgi:glycine oxidase